MSLLYVRQDLFKIVKNNIEHTMKRGHRLVTKRIDRIEGT
jgi:hypothetical protein